MDIPQKMLELADTFERRQPWGTISDEAVAAAWREAASDLRALAAEAKAEILRQPLDS